MKMFNRIVSFLLLFIPIICPVFAQKKDGKINIVGQQHKIKSVWEIGIGASISNFSRIDFTEFRQTPDRYNLKMHLRHTVPGPHIYIAREISTHFYLDLQGNLGFTEQYTAGRTRLKTVYMLGPGLQWRLGDYFHSNYVDPFFRIGVNYMKKNFAMNYMGSKGELPAEMSWVLENLYNKEGVDRNQMYPLAFGLGTNAWLNDHWGIGLQGDWLMMPHKNVANSVQGLVRLIWRIGGKSKKPEPELRYVNVDKFVEAPPKIIEKFVEIPAAVRQSASVELCDWFDNIYFEFDRSDIRPESFATLDKIAEILKRNTTKRYLVTGYTDARGGSMYNIDLSRKRAESVIKALEHRGVSASILKSRGVGKRISYAPVIESHIVREGDRKVTIEIISNAAYWEFMPKKDF